MSVLIKGMKMPENCFQCRFSRWDVEGGFCDLLNEDADMRFKRHDDCPLIEVPDHGDLIDRDVLLSKVQKWYWEALVTVKRMPAVIPAERSEE